MIYICKSIFFMFSIKIATIKDEKIRVFLYNDKKYIFRRYDKTNLYINDNLGINLNFDGSLAVFYIKRYKHTVEYECEEADKKDYISFYKR